MTVISSIDYSYSDILSSSSRIHWNIDDVISAEHRLDMTRPFLPESLARVRGLDSLSRDEQLLLNQIRGHQYLYMFGLVEEFILPFVLEHERSGASSGGEARTRALLTFASEEAKHIDMFKRFRSAFERQFPVRCDVIGPPSAIADAVLAHDPLSVALLVLHIEWFVQRHYVDSVKDDTQLDPIFCSLLKHHWIDEAQHAKLDTLLLQELAAGCNAEQIARGVDGYLAIGAFLDAGLAQQVQLDLDALERASRRKLQDSERARITELQLAANRWTYLGSGMTHPKVLEALERLSPSARKKVEEISAQFC